MDTVDRIKEVLNEVRPGLQADGGDVEYVDYKDNVVLVRLTGACGSCPMSTMTLKMGIEQAIKEAIPEVKSVENFA
ncbi:MAG: NifU family protein [Fibrobacterota bacterium]